MGRKKRREDSYSIIRSNYSALSERVQRGKHSCWFPLLLFLTFLELSRSFAVCKINSLCFLYKFDTVPRRASSSDSTVLPADRTAIGFQEAQCACTCSKALEQVSWFSLFPQGLLLHKTQLYLTAH